MTDQPQDSSADHEVDQTHPWLGLASFSEETRSYFYGREEEVGELARRVQRKLLTVLFGQSGLGKTSMLRAGIVPRLRAQGYSPVYVRIDYGPQAPSAQQQIKQAILHETAASGTWTRSGIATREESLWEFLHHRDDVLLDAQGKPLIPLLIFDQFEEIFTLAQSDDDGRLRAANFLEGLAELVENRPSKALEARLEEDDSAIERFDFTRNDYRVLITLREDYLAHLESLKAAMPSITQNRLRLAPMTGTQALAAVTGPGGKLVTKEVAEAIVRFVAGGAELSNAQIEPSLLSLICRELNDKRLASQRQEISLDLLAGSHASILTDFYERALLDQPQAIRNVIEDVLLTESGYRENVAEERVLNRLTAAGAVPDAATVLALLVNRRLLRIEDRLDIRRVELTHDVLCSVVKASRALRNEREERAGTERKLVAQRERERSTRKALVRARQIAAACLVLTVAAVASSIFGYISMKQAQQTRALADKSRDGAEKLVGYLLDDFYSELEPIGKLDMVGELARRTVDYYQNLPEAMRSTETEANRARALLRLGQVQYGELKLESAGSLLDQSIKLLETMPAAAKSSPENQLSLASAILARGRVAYTNGEHPLAKTLYDRSVAISAPLMLNPKASAQARLVNAKARIRVGYYLMRDDDNSGAQKEFRAIQDATRTAAPLESNIPLALVYLEAGSWLAESLGYSHLYADSSTQTNQVLDGLQQILRKQPNNLIAIDLMGATKFNDGFFDRDIGQSGRMANSMRDTSALFIERLRSDPGNEDLKGMIARGFGFEGIALARLGRPVDAIEATERVWDLYKNTQPSPYDAYIYTQFLDNVSEISWEIGDQKQIAITRNNLRKYGLISLNGLDTDQSAARSILSDFLILKLDALRSAPSETEASLAKLVQRAQQVQTHAKNAVAINEAESALIKIRQYAAQAAYAKGNYVGAQENSQEALNMLLQLDSADVNAPVLRMEHALALARLKRLPEARGLIKQVLDVQRSQIANRADDQMLRLELAQSLFVSALTQPNAGGKELAEAAALIAKLPLAIQNYHTVNLWRNRINDEIRLDTRAKLGTAF